MLLTHLDDKSEAGHEIKDLQAFYKVGALGLLLHVHLWIPSCLHDTTILIILNSRRLNYDSTVTKTLRFVISASQTRF